MLKSYQTKIGCIATIIQNFVQKYYRIIDYLFKDFNHYSTFGYNLNLPFEPLLFILLQIYSI